MRLVVITCGSKKRGTRAQARYLYTGSYFKAQLEWALSVAPATHIRILSAKYGLLKLTDSIDPYEKRITDDGSITAQELARQLPSGAVIESTAGVDYGKILREAAALKGCKVIIHFKDLPGMGYKIRAMKRQAALKNGRRQEGTQHHND